VVVVLPLPLLFLLDKEEADLAMLSSRARAETGKLDGNMVSNDGKWALIMRKSIL